MSTCQVNVVWGREANKSQGLGFWFGGVLHVLGQIFVENAKNGPKVYSKRANSEKNENRKSKIIWNSLGSDIF